MGGVEGVQFLSQIAEIELLLRKKRIENGRRIVFNGSNPHSYGDNLSLFGFVIVNWLLSIIRVIEIINARIMSEVVVFITFLQV